MENFTLMQKLEHLALVKISVTLWNDDDIKPYINMMTFPPNMKYDDEDYDIMMERDIKEKILRLPLPDSHSSKLLDLIKPIGLEIIKWRLFHVENCVPMDVPSNLCWTSRGTIDKKKTAEALIKDERLDITLRYKLSCIYCLQDDIPQLWDKMPEDCKKIFYSEQGPTHVCLTQKQEIVVFWTYAIKGEVDKMDSIIDTNSRRRHLTPHQYVFEHAACGGNRAVVEYFLKKLTPMERRESLLSAAVRAAVAVGEASKSREIDKFKNECADILLFLLSQMTEELQNYLFRRYACEVVQSLLDWPWQGSFVKIAKRVMPFLQTRFYGYLLYSILDKVIAEWKDFDYQKLFGEFWQLCVHTDRRHVISEFPWTYGLLEMLLKIKDKENIALILNSATTAEKERVFFSSDARCIWQDLAFEGEWDLLKFCVGKCLSSQDREIVKEKFKQFTSRETKNEWNDLFEVLDSHIFGVNKKKNMEENERPAKFLRTMETEGQKESK